MTEERDLVGKRLGHYEIMRPLGAGGMGEVYRARDTNLQRDVAIKVLPEALAVDTERLARLRHEAHLLASVNHPNIAAIYNLEESEGTRWLVLELVEGKTLAQMLRGGPLPVAESLRIGAQVASALEAAHEKGIVHRDLKSANVMIDAKGRVKVLDFGIAKDISGDRPSADAAAADTSLGTEVVSGLSAHLTATGVIVGTAPYMSPEQIRGRKVDKRIDNWAFGCLMFELLTGRRPFARETMADTLSAILEHEPNWDLLPADTPPGMEALIRRCLQKDADSRLHDIADARVEISEIEATDTSSKFPARARRSAISTSWRSRRGPQIGAAIVVTALVVLAVGWGVSSLGGRPDGAIEADVLPAYAVAVLPFDNNSLEADDTLYLADGLAITLHSALQGVDGLTVSAWTSSSMFRGSGEALATIGRDLGVSKLVHGDVRVAGNSLSVYVELTDVESGLPLWTTRSNWQRDDVEGLFAFQEEVAREVAVALDLEISGEGGVRPTESLEAYDAYLRGLEAYPRRDADALFEARRFFEDAIGHDPDFVLAHAWLASTQRMLAAFVLGGQERGAALDSALASADKAIELDPLIGRAWGVKGAVKGFRGEPGWEADFDRALDLNPNDSLTHQSYGWELMVRRGGVDGAWSHTLKAAQLDPRMAAPRENLTLLALGGSDFVQALDHAQQAVALDETYALGRMNLGMVLHYSSRTEEGLEQFREARRLNSEDFRHTRNLVRALLESGSGTEAVSILNQWANIHPDDPQPFTLLGDVYRVSGSLDNAARMYQASYDSRPAARAGVALALLDLDRGDEAAAAERIGVLEANFANTPQGPAWIRVGRLNLEMFGSQYSQESTAAWRGLGDDQLIPSFVLNWELYTNQQPLEPIGYFGVLAGFPEESLRVFETTFPELLGDDPPVHAFTLKAAIDLAAVYVSMGDDRADQLLGSAETFIESLPDSLRRYQFREAPMQIYALQGRTEDALDAIERAIEDGFLSGWWRLERKPHFESLRAEPRFQAMVEQLRQTAAR